MAKDSQIDPKPVREMKAQGKMSFAASEADNGSNNAKRQSGNRNKANDDKR